MISLRRRTLLSRSGRSLCALGIAAVSIIASRSITRAQTAAHPLPPNYRVILENRAIEVIRVHYGPHERVPVHDHSTDPTVYVYLSDSGPVRFTHFEGGAGVLTRPPIKAGAFRVSPGRRERHSVENLGDIPSDFLRIELKGLAFGTLEPFRGEAPADLSHSATTAEVKTPQLAIDRIVCVGTAPCALTSQKEPSLVVAFTPAQLDDQEGRSLSVGDALWIVAGRAATVRASSGQPAHLLRVTVLAKR